MGTVTDSSDAPESTLRRSVSARIRRLVARLRLSSGRYLSVRIKLTLWYGTMCALTLGVVGIGMHDALDVKVKSTISRELESTAQVMSGSLTQVDRRQFPAPVPCTQAVQARLLDRFESRLQQQLDLYAVQSSKPGQFEEVYISAPGFPDSTLVSRTAPQEPGYRGITMLPQSISEVIFKHNRVHSSYSWNGTQYDAFFVPLSLPSSLQSCSTGRLVGVLEVVLPSHAYAPILQALDGIIVLGIPIGLIIALVVGWWIARAALRPIDRISRTVQDVGESRNLSRRVNFVGPLDEVGRLAHTFDAMMQRLERSFEAQRRFIADASHELRTPLTAIRGNADLISIAPPDERDVCVAFIRREAERMTRLVNDLLLLAEADADGQMIHRSDVDLAWLIADVFQSAVILAAGKVDVKLEARDHVTLLADADRLKQLLLNLVDNAIKFTPPGGTVTLRLTVQSGVACMEIADTGAGIPSEQLHAIFDRFYRLDRSRSGQGAGLGLSISQWIVSAHGGTIDVRSTPGQGSTFSVRLPIGKDGRSADSR